MRVGRGVGLFVMAGTLVLAITLVWVKGKQIRAQTRKYGAVFEFQQAQGITVGTPVQIRGVNVGNVVQVQPSLERIDVVVELAVDIGLISETLIDVTLRPPLPKPTVGPLDPSCPSEALIVCDRGRIKGEQGVSLDELVGVCTKLARQINSLGVERFAAMAFSGVKDLFQFNQELQRLNPEIGTVREFRPSNNLLCEGSSGSAPVPGGSVPLQQDGFN